MKRQIRSNVFETNSSSTHSIAISKAPVVIGKRIHFGIGEFGWEHDCVDTADYLYTAILEQDNADELLDRLKEILDKHSIEYSFKEPRYNKSADGQYTWLAYGYIDHGYELEEFLDTILSNEDLLMRYLFGDSFVYTGNDNTDDPNSMCYCAESTVWDNNYNSVPNPNHHSDLYDYFFKGN